MQLKDIQLAVTIYTKIVRVTSLTYSDSDISSFLLTEIAIVL